MTMIANYMEQARENMVKQQVRTWGVLNPKVLDTIADMPREDFVPEQYRELAFADTEIALGHGRKMMAPKMEAKILQALDIQPEDNILEIGTGSGYLTACLASLGGSVTSIEIQDDLTARAAQLLPDHSINNVKLITGNGLSLTEELGPFDVIVLTGSLPKVSEKLTRLLNMGGRLFVVAGDSPAMQATMFTRVGDYQWREEVLFETDLERLVMPDTTGEFVF